MAGGHQFNRPDVAEHVLLPTPTAMDMGRGRTPEEWDDWRGEMQERHRNGNGHGRSLEIEAQRLLPTPLASDGEKGGPNQRGGSGDLRLSSAVLLPTPTRRDHKGANQRRDETCLHGALTAPRSTTGSESSDDQLPGQLSLDSTESA
jgi:DNA (cytosine-5)-methyltransferase 1